MTAKKIISIRRRLGLTEGELAGRLGVARATVTRWENGSWRPSRIADLTFRAVQETKHLRAWQDLAGTALNELWANPQDAVYDDWRARYRPQAR